MALLTRFFGVPDGSEVFNFVVTKSVTRDTRREVVSKEFAHANHNWAISFKREDKMLGLFLLWRSSSSCVRVTTDLVFTLVNRESFGENRTFAIRRATFHGDYVASGNRAFIAVVDLLTHRPRFVDANGEFLVELQLSNSETCFEHDFLFPRDLAARLKNCDNSDKEENGCEERVSPDFRFGVFVLAAKIRPVLVMPTVGREEAGIRVSLGRCRAPLSQSLVCRLHYQLSLASRSNNNNEELQSELKDEMIGALERGSSWTPRSNLQNCLFDSNKGLVRLRINLISAMPITEFVTAPAAPQDEDEYVYNGHGHAVTGLDANRLSWSLEASLNSSFLRFSLALIDAAKIPRNHLRLVHWRAFLVRRIRRWRGHRENQRDNLELVELQPNHVYGRYYCLEDADAGVVMETTLAAKEIRDGVSEFLEEGNLIRVRIQWVLSHQLFQATLHPFDEVVRLHSLQMRQEMSGLRDRVRRLEVALLKSRAKPKTSSSSNEQLGVDVNRERRTSSLGDDRHLEAHNNYSKEVFNDNKQHSLDNSPACSPRYKVQEGLKKILGIVPPLKVGEQVGEECPSSGETTEDNKGRRLWQSAPLRRLMAPLRQSLSVSADNLQKPVSPLARSPWCDRQSQMAKCQSID